MPVEVGTKAPPFDLPTDGGGRISLGAVKDGSAVLFFYPRADTPACTNEALDFSALADDFARAGATVIGVSRDPVRKLDRFKAKYDLKVMLASDEDGAVCEAFGVWIEKQLYGRRYMGVERATFLIDGGGTVLQTWRKVSVKGHAQDVLAAVRSVSEA